ncbi:transporter substrate-binding domain-containing protein [Georgenia alba]|uniref:Transporter substrate-binding domain-containing protein n=1 Tax=Georgenia alba TaxID=2233858 RepID=A0ABW2QAD9_9MICO
MTRTRLAPTAAVAGVLLALAACTSGTGGGDTGGDAGGGSPGASGEVNPDAPLYDQLPPEIQDAGAITIATDTHPPYRTVEDGGEVTGIDPDLQVALAEQLGVPFEPQLTSGLDAILTGMLSGRYDAFNGPVRTTPEREADFDAVVWMTTRTSYVYSAERQDELGEPTALCGARVAGVTGSVTESQLELYNEWCAGEGLEPAEFMGFDDTNSTFLAVNSDRADYAGTTESAALDLQASDPGTYEYIVQTDEQGAGTDQLAMFMPKGNGLAEPMHAAFEAIFENGEYERVMGEWGLEDVMVDAPTLNPMSGQ